LCDSPTKIFTFATKVSMLCYLLARYVVIIEICILTHCRDKIFTDENFALQVMMAVNARCCILYTL